MTRRLILALLSGLVMCSVRTWSDPVDLSAPTGGVGAAGLYGNLDLWQEVDGAGVKLDPESYLPFRYKFTSDSSVRGMLGPGFYVPMFEAKNVLIREKMMRAYLPCGKGLYMRRNDTDPNKFQTLDQVWTGYLTNDGDDFVIWRNDGWKLLYHKSRLTSLTSDDNHIFTWSYDAGGLPTGLSKDGQTLVTIEPNAAGQVAAFIFSGKRYEVSYAERPITEMLLGQVAIKELDQSLASFKYPDGKTETFHFELTPDRIPTVAFTNKNGQTTLYTWDPASLNIATETGPNGNWAYIVTPSDQPFGVPVVSRKGNNHEIESIAIDIKEGTYERQLADGSKTITHIFETPGPLYQKIHSIDKITNTGGKEIAVQIYRASYDETGRIIRKVDDKGYITTYTYDTAGKMMGQITTLPQDAATLKSIKEKETELVKLIATATNDYDRQEAILNLARYYLFENMDPAKASVVASRLDHRHSFGIRVQTIDYNQKLSPAQKIAAYQALLSQYPEYKDRLNTLIKARQQEETHG